MAKLIKNSSHPSTNCRAQYLFWCLFACLSFVSLKAQSNQQKNLRHVNEVLSDLQKASPTEAARLSDLLTKVQPSIYLESNSFKPFAEQPVVLFSDTASLRADVIFPANSNTVELVVLKVIRHPDLSDLDLALLSSLPQLKNIFIVCEFEVDHAAISANLKNVPPDAAIFYSISKPS